MNNKLTPEEYHEWFKKTYKTIDKITNQRTKYRTVVRGGQVYIILIDKNGQEIQEEDTREENK